MSDMTLVKRLGAGLAVFAVAGGMAIGTAGIASAHEGEDHGDTSSSSSFGHVPGKADQPKDTTKVHNLVPEKPVEDLAEATSGTPASSVTEGLDHHLKNFHSVSLGDYAENNIEDPMGYSVGTHVDMTENMLGMPGAFDEEQETLGATPKPEFQEED